jgi:magnesium transporter
VLTVFHWDATTRKGSWLPSEALAGRTPPPEGSGDVWWLDLSGPDVGEEEAALKKFLPVHPLTFEDITRPNDGRPGTTHLPKVEEFSDYLFVVVNPLSLPGPETPLTGDRVPPATQLSAVLTHNVLITHHKANLGCVHALRCYLERHTEQADRGPDFLFHLVLDGMVDAYAPLLDQMSEALDEIEDDVFRRPSTRLLGRLLSLKRNLVRLRKTLVLERELLARLTRGEFRLIDPREMAYYRNVYDHLARYAELAEGAREMISDLMATHLSAVSNRLNEIMKVLTLISTVGMVCAVVAGIYGMNFDPDASPYNMPELRWKYGYFFALGLMALSVAAVLGFFRWKRWL